MAVRFDASGESYSRDASLPAITAWTIAGWFYRSADLGVSEGLLSFGATVSPNYVTIYQDGSAEKIAIWDGSAYATHASLSQSLNTWAHWALTCSGTALTLYFNGVAAMTATRNASVANTRLYLGNNLDDERCSGRLAWVKVWGTVLAANEVMAEMWSAPPVKRDSLNAFYPLRHVGEGVTDHSGNGYTLTANGTLTTEDGPPGVAYPRQRTVKRAARLFLPLDANAGAGADPGAPTGRLALIGCGR
jgi:hypothetical protein